MTFDRHAQHPYNYGQPYQPSQQQPQPQHSQQSPYLPPQDQQQQQQQQQQQPYIGAPLPWPPPPSGSGLVGTDMTTYGQPIPSISSPTQSTVATSISASNTTSNITSGTSSSTTTTSSTQQQQKTETIESTQQDPNKQYHPEWGVLREQDFHPLALKHQRDLENHFQNGTRITDFYFWQANLGGYCMADMNQNIVVSSEGVFVLVRRMVEGAPHPGRKKKKRGMN